MIQWINFIRRSPKCKKNKKIFYKPYIFESEGLSLGICTTDKKRARMPFGIITVFFAAVLLLISLMPAFSVNAAGYNEKSTYAIGCSAVLYNNSNGLPTSEANDIVQSDDGFIWIGGYSGLIRYDGNEFYRFESNSGISSVVTLFIDSSQRLWIGTNDSGVAMYENNNFTFYSRYSGLRSLSIRSIEEDNDGNIIIATTNGISYVSPEGELGTIDDTLINNEYICEILKGTDGVIYGVTLLGSVFTLENKRITGFYSPSDIGLGTINTVYPDPEHKGFVYLGTNESNIYYTNIEQGMKTYKTISAAPLETINSIRNYDGKVWVCSDSGIGFFESDGTFVHLIDLPMTNSIDHMTRDYEGNIWFSSSRQGVMKIVANRFSDISEMASLPTLVVNSTYTDGSDLYIATDNGLYILNNEYRSVTNELTQLLDGVRIRCIKQDLDGCLWFCTYSANGLVRYDPSTGKTTTFTENDGMASNRVRMLTVLSDGSIAAATNAGVNIIRDGKVVSTYGSNIGIGNLEILCVEEGENGKIYLGSDGGGIYIVDGKKVSRIGSENGLKSEVILRLKKDPVEKNTYWIITSNSISYMKDETVTNVTTFPYSNNFDIFFDVNDRAWILSSNGIYIAKHGDLMADSVGEYTLFDRDYGLPGIATANSYSHITESGDLFVSASTGVYKVNINDETGGSGDIKLSIPFISLDDKLISVGNLDTIRIPSNVRRLNIYANAYTYSLINPHLCYMLEGFDDEFYHLTKQDMTYASYTNLREGTYKFVLSIIDDVTGETKKTVSLTLIKGTAIYEQTWFIIVSVVLLVLLIVLVIYLVFRRKTKLIQKKQEETRKLVNEMIKAFAGCVDMKDNYTNGHSARVAKYTAMIAEKMGKDPAQVEDIYNIALLHDIGKISIPDSILNKPGKLSDEEYAIMKSHAQRGYDILKDITIAPDLALGAGYHHEKYDGTGYPSGLKGNEIPEIARMIAVADAFDAMYSTRPYRKKLPIEVVAAEIKRCSGTQFAPEIAEIMLKLIDEGKFNDDATV